MKRLTILAPVFALAAPANAALTDIRIEVDGEDPGSYVDVLSGIVSIEVYSGNTDTGLAYLGLEESDLWSFNGSVPSDYITVTSNAGDQGGYVGPYSYSGYQEIELTVSATASGTITPGTMMMVEITTTSLDWGLFDVYLIEGDTFTTVDTLTVGVNIPEPMTLVLLGAGGVALLGRRRR